jgi:hypothetical protein
MIEQVLQLLHQILSLVQDLPERLRIAANQINVTSLSEISEKLGMIRAGEFRAGNEVDPGFGFSGMRIAYPPLYYEDAPWNLVGVSNDVLQVGISASDGKFYAAAGRLIVDKDFISVTGLNYAYTHSATYGTDTRNALMGFWIPDGSSTPAFGFRFYGNVDTSNLVSNGTFETGDLTGWTQSASSFSASTTLPYNGQYSLKCDEVTSGTETLTSDRMEVTGNTPYQISLATKESYSQTSTTVDIPITVDTKINSGDPTTNYETATSIPIGYYYTVLNSRALLKPDLSSIPANAILTSSSLYMYCHDADSNTNPTIGVYRLTKAFTESGATWNSYNGVNTWTTPGGFSSSDCEQQGIGGATSIALGWLEIPIDHSKLQEIIDGDFTNLGWLLRMNIEDTIPTVSYRKRVIRPGGQTTFVDITDTSSVANSLYYFRSGEYATAAYRPRLTASYSVGYPSDYVITVKWYDAASGGNLIRSDVIATENNIVVWNLRSTTLTSPASALSCEIIITATVGESFYIDDIEVSAVSVNKTLYFAPDLTAKDEVGNLYRIPPPIAMVSISGQSVADSSDTIMSFSTEIKDTDAIWGSGSPTKLICKTAGLYKIFGSVHPASDADGIRKVSIEHNSSGTLADIILSNTAVAVDNSPNIPIEVVYDLAVNDELTLHFYHTAGGALNVDATFGMVYYGGSA